MNSRREDKQDKLQRALAAGIGLTAGGALGSTVIADSLENNPQFLQDVNPIAAGTLTGVGAGILGSAAATALISGIRRSAYKKKAKKYNLAYR